MTQPTQAGATTVEHHGPARVVPARDEVIERGLASGLTLVAVGSAEPFTTTREILEERKAAGLHGGMNFTYRNPARSTDPQRIMSDAASIVVGAYRYGSDLPDQPSGVVARVARYATDRHYERLRSALQIVANELESTGWTAKVVLDSNELVDRAAAVRAGLGWYGKNANILLPQRGSWFILGSVVTNAPIEVSPPVEYRGCGTCTRCLDDCPTGALVGPGVLDASRCLAWLVQQGGDFPREYRQALGDRIYGCDICQEVCPPTIRSDRHQTNEPDQIAPKHQSSSNGSPGSWVDMMWLLTASEDELLERLGAWYIPQRDVRYLQRNALIIVGNVLAEQSTLNAADYEQARDVLGTFVASDDPMLATHAAWAIVRSDDDQLLATWGHLGVIQQERDAATHDFHQARAVAQTNQVTSVTLSPTKAPIS